MTTAAALLPRSKDPVSQLLALAEEQRQQLLAAADSWDPFAPAWVSRLALCDSLSRLLFLDLESALDRKLEQELWNVGFKEPVAAAQKAASASGAGQAKLAALLEHGLGFYTSLLQELCTVFQISLPCRRRLTHSTVLEPVVLVIKAKWPTKGSLAYLCQHCLVHLGDICRYQRRSDQAMLYYNWAVQTCPSNGHPFNQLAIVASQEAGRQLATFFYYIRAMSCATPFTAARANLEKLLAGQARSAKACLQSGGGCGGRHESSGVLFLHYHALLSAARDVARARQLWDAFLAAYALRPDSSWEDCVQLVAIHVFAMHRLLTQGEQDTSELLSLQRQATAQLLELLADISAAALSPPASSAASAAAAVAGVPQLAGLHTLLRWCDLKPTAAAAATTGGLPRLACLLNRLQQRLPPQSQAGLADEEAVAAAILPELQLLQGFLPLFPKGRAPPQPPQEQKPPPPLEQQPLPAESPSQPPLLDSIGRLRASRCVALGLRLAGHLPACLLAQQAPGSDAAAAWSFAAPAATAAAASAVRQQQQQQQANQGQKRGGKQNVALQSLLSNRGPQLQQQQPAASASSSAEDASPQSPAAQPQRGKLVLSSDIARSIQEHAAQVASARTADDQSPSHLTAASAAATAAATPAGQRQQQQQMLAAQRVQQLAPRFQRRLLEQQQQQQPQPGLDLLAKKESEPIFPASLFERPPPAASAAPAPALLPIGRANWPTGAVPPLESLVQQQKQKQQQQQQQQVRSAFSPFSPSWPPPEQ